MATRTFHKTKPVARMVRLANRAKSIIRTTATRITDGQSLANIHNMVIAHDDVSKIREINRDAFRVSKELALFHSAFRNKHEMQLCATLQSQLKEIEKRCACAEEHLNAHSNNMS